jgi:hypothetical protein
MHVFRSNGLYCYSVVFQSYLIQDTAVKRDPLKHNTGNI